MKKKLKGMPRDQQKQLLDYLLLITQESDDKDRDLDLWKESCLNQLSKILPGSPVHVPKGSKLFSQLKESHVIANRFVSTIGFVGITVIEKKAIYELLATLLVARAKDLAGKSTAPLSLRLVFQCSPDLPGLFDAAFPGYLESGLARKVLDQIIGRIGRRSITTGAS